jgi:hypothetical protein
MIIRSAVSPSFGESVPVQELSMSLGYDLAYMDTSLSS